MKSREAKLFLNSIRNINNKYQKTQKKKKIGYEMSESHSPEKYYKHQNYTNSENNNKENDYTK